MNTVDAGLVQPLEFLCCTNVRQHHELFDEAVAVEPGAGRDGGDVALFVQHHLPLGQIEVERAARDTGGQQGAERGIKWRDGQAEIFT